MNDDDLWKKRYAVMQTVRIGGLLIALVGLLVAKGGVLTEEAYPAIGAFLVVAGLFEAALSPKILAKIFRDQDGEA